MYNIQDLGVAYPVRVGGTLCKSSDTLKFPLECGTCSVYEGPHALFVQARRTKVDHLMRHLQ